MTFQVHTQTSIGNLHVVHCVKHCSQWTPKSQTASTCRVVNIKTKTTEVFAEHGNEI